MKNKIDNKFTELPKVFTTMIERVTVDGKEYKNIMEWYNSLQKKEGDFVIILNKRKFNFNPVKTESKEFRIIV